eukprot:g11441.t1 g11441   contig5:866206-866985(-)
MTLVSSYRTASSTDAKSLLNAGPATLADLTSILASAPHSASSLSDAESAFAALLASSSSVEQTNATVDTLYNSVRSALSTGVSQIRTLERFVMLHIPQMEDGNNFGVTVQMMFGKLLKEEREKMEKALGDSSKYYEKRADAVDKFTHLPKTSTSETTSTSSSTATGGKEGDESKTSSSTVKETKVTTPVDTSGMPNVHRVKALAALDAQMYMELMGALQSTVDGWCVILDNLEKNWEKLENPRGKGYGGYGSGGSSMVY